MTEQGTNPKDLVGAKKAALELVPPALLIGAAEAIENGAGKYGSYNWRDYPVQSMTYVGAMLRHLLAYLDGEDNASDSGIHHLRHVAAGCGILLDAIASGSVIDNRPPKGPAPKLLAELDRSVATTRTPVETPGDSVGVAVEFRPIGPPPPEARLPLETPAFGSTPMGGQVGQGRCECIGRPRRQSDGSLCANRCAG